MKKVIFFFIAFNLLNQLQAQNVGIGTTSPRQSAVLDINSTNKGVLFPRLTYAQILNIANPANGLHVFNTDVNSLQFYDSTQTKWVSYSKDITEYQIKSNQVFNLPYPLETRVIVITVHPGVYAYIDLFDVSSAPAGTKVILFNYGNIIGKSGRGGRGGTRESCGTTVGGFVGETGGSAITTANQINLNVFNYGFIAGGGGGGGGGGYNNGQFATTNYGGGGGTGQGLQFSPPNLFGGDGGWRYCTPPYNGNLNDASNGNPGNLTAPGTGGAGNPGGIFNTGGTGGNGSGYAQIGTVGTGALPGAGGAGGKAIALFGGGTNYSNTVTNIGAGVVIGVVD